MNNEKKLYADPEMEVILLDNTDVITTSGDDGFGDEEDNQGGGTV